MLAQPASDINTIRRKEPHMTDRQKGKTGINNWSDARLAWLER